MPHYLLTEPLIEQLRCPSGRAHREIFDSHLPGLYVDALRSGRVAYRVRYRAHGRYRVVTLGDARVLTLDEARQQARAVQRDVISGADPKARMTPAWPQGMTLAAFFHEHYLPYVRSYKRSWRTDAILYHRHLAPAWGARGMATLTAQEIAALVLDLRGRGYAPASCNRLLAVLRYAYTLAIRWELLAASCHPARAIQDLKEDNRRERYLSPDEASRLLASARRSLNGDLGDLVSLLLYTGARRSEVLQARRGDVDRYHRLWRIPRTKAGQVRHVPLSAAAMRVFERRLAACSPGEPKSGYLFANPATGRPYTSFFVSWTTACARAGLAGLRIHDLRHSFASFLVNAGHSLYEVQTLLGHANLHTTTRYAHLSRERLFQAVEAVPGWE